MPRLASPPPRGRWLVAPAAVTPGRAASRAPTCSKARSRDASSLYRAEGSARLNVRAPPVANPHSDRSSAWKLRTVRPAANNSSEASAISETTSAMRMRRLTPAGARPPSFRATFTSCPARFQAGSRPNTTPVTTESASVNISTRGSSRMWLRPTNATPSGVSWRSAAIAHHATNSPAAPPARPSTTDSVSICPAIRVRPAPTALRTATSRRRFAAFASSRLATFTHAISSTNADRGEQQPERGGDRPSEQITERE